MSTDTVIDAALSTVHLEPEQKGQKRKRDEPIVDPQQDWGEEDPLPLCSIEEKSRNLIRQINSIRNVHPEAYERATRFGEDPFSQLPENELKAFLGILKEEAGISGPYDDAKAITSLCGAAIEKFFGLEGVSILLSNDPDVISGVYELIPAKFKNFTGSFKLFSRVIEVIGSQLSAVQKKRTTEMKAFTSHLHVEASKIPIPPQPNPTPEKNSNEKK